MKKNLTSLILLLLATMSDYSQSTVTATDSKTVTFCFQPGKDMCGLKGNENELQRPCSLVDEYYSGITNGTIPVYEDSYYASLPTKKENLSTTYVQANRVKPELITQKKPKDTDFEMANYATHYNRNKNVKVVTPRIPVKTERIKPVVKEEPKTESRTKTKRKTQPVVKEKNTKPTKILTNKSVPASVELIQPYRFALRTNLLYDALLLPTLGVEWRIDRHIGVKLDGSLSRWGGEHGKVQKVWLLNPEVRWYLLRDRRLYAGVAGSYGEYNIYRYTLGNAFSKDTGYQGKMWSAGLTVGYQLRLSRCLSVDFNLGLGYVRSHYDSFGLTDGVRVYKDRDKTKNLFGPTQAGISLVWTMGGGK